MVTGCTSPKGIKEDYRLFELLHNSPLWVKLSSHNNKTPNDKLLRNIENRLENISKYDLSHIRAAMVRYLAEAGDNPLEVSARLDNCQILCVFIFDLPTSHPYWRYFEMNNTGSLKLRLPVFVDSVNNARNGNQNSVTYLLESFDHFASIYKQRRFNRQEPIQGVMLLNDH
jgi:hypothetical protein